MRSLLFVAVSVAGLAVGYQWCFNKPSVSGLRNTPPAATTTFDQDRAVKNYVNRVPMYDVSAKTEKHPSVTVTTITYTPKPPQ
jgi:hypothetical protein